MENIKGQEQGGQNLIESDNSGVSKVLSYAVGMKPERVEQERTRVKKKLFLQYFERSFGVISAACEKAEITMETYYQWKRIDPDFAANVAKAESQKNDVAADILWGKVTIEKDGPSTRYYLDRRHPGFKPRSVQEVVVGDRTLEDILDEDEANLRKKKDDAAQADTNKQGADRGDVVDPQQAGGDGAVQAEPSAGAVPAIADPAKPDTESPAKGNQ